MKRNLLVGLLCGFLLLFSVGAAGADKPSGLDRLTDEPGNLYVAYLGGSITEGAGGSGSISYGDGAGSGHARWSSQLTKRYFQKKFPHKKVIEVNAGVGGTGSNLGLFRMEKDVVERCGGEGPDVVFVEFAVNDGWLNTHLPQQGKQQMEGIVRQLSKLPKQPVIIFVYTAALDSPGDFTTCLESAKVQQEVAEAYGIGSLCLSEYVAGGTDLDGNAIVWDHNQKNSWTGDGTHPSNLGYTKYTDYIIRQFETRYEDYFKNPTRHEAPLFGYEFGHPAALSHDSERIAYTGEWQRIKSTELPYVYGKFGETTGVTSAAGATASLQFSGRSIGLYIGRGKWGAKVSYVIDQGSSQPITGVVDQYNGTNYWMPTITLFRSDLRPGEHTITLTVMQPEAGQEERNQFLLGYFLLDEEQPAPTVTGVALPKNVRAGEKILAGYTYVNPAEEGESRIEWLASDFPTGEKRPVGTGREFTPGTDLIGQYLFLQVTPVNCLSTAGAGVLSEPVQVRRPSAETAGETRGITYRQDGTAAAQVTNRLTGAVLPVTMLTAEYRVDEQGRREMIQIKSQSRHILGGKTAEISVKLTPSEGSLVQTVLLCADTLEPLCSPVSYWQNTTENAVWTGTKQEGEIPVSVYQINGFSN